MRLLIHFFHTLADVLLLTVHRPHEPTSATTAPFQ
jgi:hypothetical protein